jgi:hypothetical protein
VHSWESRDDYEQTKVLAVSHYGYVRGSCHDKLCPNSSPNAVLDGEPTDLRRTYAYLGI